MICDEPVCRKWRILEISWPHKRFYCGHRIKRHGKVRHRSRSPRLFVFPSLSSSASSSAFSPPPRPHYSFQACSRVDDWIVRCLGGDADKAKELQRHGISTVEDLERSPKKLDVLRGLGFYYDANTQAIKALQ